MGWIGSLKDMLGLWSPVEKEIIDFIAAEDMTISLEESKRKRYFDWEEVFDIYSFTFSEGFIRCFAHQYNEEDWFSISFNQHLSENFIYDFKNKISWEEVCAVQIMSETFLRKIEPYIIHPNCWYYIFNNPDNDFSQKFIDEFSYKTIGSTI